MAHAKVRGLSPGIVSGPEEEEKDEPPVRKIKYLRTKDITTVTRVTSEAEWEKLQRLLDKKVRQLLAEG
jgi:hypothetical protein